MPTMLEHALSLAERGLHVFPLKPNGRTPMDTLWQHFASNDPAYVREAWSKPGYADCNPGVCTTNMVVFDVDVKNGKPGIDSYASAGGHYETFVVRTATGGYHCYFEGPDSGLRVDLFPGVDVRSHNGYVIGPGSVVDAGQYEIVTDKPRAPVPDVLLPFLRPPVLRSQAPTAVDLDTSTSIANAIAWLAQEPPAIEGLGGDTHTYRTAARLVRDYALSAEVAFGVLEQHWNEKCIPPWSRDELWAKVQNASGYASGAVGTALPQMHFGPVDLPPPSYDTVEPLSRGLYLGNLPPAFSIKRRPWLVSKFALQGDVTILGGAGAGGKSMLNLTAAAHFAVGRDFGAWKLDAPGMPLRSLMYNAEDDMQEQGRRLWAVCEEYNLDYDKVRSNIVAFSDAECSLCLAYLDQGHPKPVELAVKFIEDAALASAVHLVFFDPLVNIHSMRENDNSDMQFLIALIRRIARNTKTAVIAAHHTVKDAGRERGDAAVLRGAGALINSARIGLLLSSFTGEDIKTFGVKEDEVRRYLRVDDAKANVYLRTSGALMHFRMNSTRIASGDIIGVPTLADMKARQDEVRLNTARTLMEGMEAAGMGIVSLSEAGRIMENTDELWAKATKTTRIAWIRRDIPHAVDTGKGIITVTKEGVTLT